VPAGLAGLKTVATPPPRPARPAAPSLAELPADPVVAAPAAPPPPRAVAPRPERAGGAPTVAARADPPVEPPPLPTREPGLRALIDRETPALEILRALPQHGAGTRRFVARGEQLRRKALAQPDAMPRHLDPQTLEERMEHQLAHTLSAIGDDDFGRSAGRWARRVLWILALIAIAAAAFLRFQINIGI